MLPRNSLRRVLTLAAALSAIITASLWACSVPVFRYALERWLSDPYQAIVFHRGPLTAAQQTQVKNLTPAGLAGRLHANVSARTVDLDQNPNADSLALWQQSKSATLPWLVLQYPAAAKIPGAVWSGPLAESSIHQALDSPLRRDLVQRLTKSDSVVWVLLEIGDPPRDDAAAKLLQARLTYLTSVLKLPKLDPQDVVSGAEEQLRLAFSTVRLSRTNAAEQVFANMLLGSEPDLHEIAEPLVFPIFGRGRVLYALAGKGITHENIDQAASFLIGACSCEVKEQNPGVDLLFAADWDKLFKATLAPDKDLASLPGLTGVGPKGTALGKTNETGNPAPENTGAVEVVSIQSAEPVTPRGPMAGSRLWIGGLAVALLVAAAALLRRR